MSKTCNSCKINKPLGEFSPLKNGMMGRRARCKSCEAKLARERRSKNPQAARAAVEKYRLSNPDVIARRDARYYQKNKSRLGQKTKQWRKDNPEKYAELNRRKENIRRARKMYNGTGPYTEQQMLDLYGTCCHLCNLPIDLTQARRVGIPGWELGLQIDHLVPISKGGPDTLDNVKPAHGKCNLDKGSTVQ